MTRSELESQKDPISSGIGNANTEIVQQQGAASNGVTIAKAVVPPPVATTSTSTTIPGNTVTENGETKLKMEKDI